MGAQSKYTPGVVGSAFAPEEQLRRFTEGVEVPTELAGGSTSTPMRQDPALVWFQIQQNSEKGIVRAL
jgi:hypothetical protein